MRVYKTLIAADRYRDGGSLEARFICADGTLETIWLQAAESPDGLIFIHTDLSLYADADRQSAPQRITKGSKEEDLLLSALEKFLRHPHVNVPFSRGTSDESYLKTVEDLVASIPERTA
jgi:serine phosphatase RsbU (regulator of sigma subunit)